MQSKDALRKIGGYVSTAYGAVRMILDFIGRIETAKDLIPSWRALGEFFLHNWLSVIILAVGLCLLWKDDQEITVGTSKWKRMIYRIKHHGVTAAILILVAIVVVGSSVTAGVERIIEHPKPSLPPTALDKKPNITPPEQPPIESPKPEIKKPKPKRKTAPEAKPAPQPPQPLTQVCPQGICNGGDNNGQQNVYNYGPPPIHLTWEVRDVVPPMDEPTYGIKASNSSYEKEVTITPDVETPVSVAVYCTAEIKNIGASLKGNSAIFTPKLGTSASDKTVGIVSFSGTPMSSSNPLVVRIWSNDPLSVTKVTQVRLRN